MTGQRGFGRAAPPPVHGFAPRYYQLPPITVAQPARAPRPGHAPRPASGETHSSYWRPLKSPKR
jgi:hypothetical protein